MLLEYHIPIKTLACYRYLDSKLCKARRFLTLNAYLSMFNLKLEVWEN